MCVFVGFQMSSCGVLWAVKCCRIEALGTFGLQAEVLGGEVERLLVVMWPKITKVGYFIRKYKLDELAQLWNVLLGEMSLVGPRPEVPRYVALYTDEQKQLLCIKPGITDLASLYYFEEAKILANAEDPEVAYVNEVMPDKLRYSLDYLSKRNVGYDIYLILLTILRIAGFKLKKVD